MKIYIKELKREFDNKSEAFKALKEAKETIVASKKSDILRSHEKLVGVPLISLKIADTVKGLDTSEGVYHIVMNTTNVLDSHDDLHVKGIWEDDLAEAQAENSVCVDHEDTIEGTAVCNDKLTIQVLDTSFKDLGLDLDGDTQALVYSFNANDVIHSKAKNWLESGSDIQGSVSMRYVDISLALNSTEEEDKEEFKLFTEYYSKIANKSDYEHGIDYFWVVKKAKNKRESSLVKRGSNRFTGVVKTDSKKEGVNVSELVKGLKIEKKEGLNFIELIKELKK